MDLTGLFPLVALVAVFYLMVIRPQQKRNKQQQELQSSLALGDRIMTYAGIYATVVEVGDPLVVRIADGVEIEIAPASVSQRLEPAEVAESDEPLDEAASSDLTDDSNA